MAQSVKHPTPDFGSGHDLTVPEIEPRLGLHTNSAKPAWDCLSLPLSALPPLAHARALSLSLSKINIKNFFLIKFKKTYIS